MKEKSSLRFLRAEYLPIGSGPHPLWLSCGSSPSAIEAAVIQAKILTGPYRDDYLCSKWDNQSGNCKMCNFFPGDCLHYLSGTCSYLSEALSQTLQHSLDILSTTPLLLDTVLSSLQQPSDQWVKFILDPSTDRNVIKIKQEFGVRAIWPLFRLSRAYIWSMHRQRMRYLNGQK